MDGVTSRVAVRILMVVVVAGALTSCSGVADKTRTVVKNLNPVNWFGDDDDEDENKKKPLVVEKRDAKQKAYPKLGSVPVRPKKSSPEAETQRIAKGLSADTQNARYSDQQLRQSASVFGGNLRPPSTINRGRPIDEPKRVTTIAPPSVKRDGESQAARSSLTSPRRGIVPPAIRPPATVAPPSPIARPSRVKAPKAIRNAMQAQTPSVNSDSLASPGVERVGSPIVRQTRTTTSATPVGRPLKSPKAPPLATPVGRPMNERTVPFQPPVAARVSSVPRGTPNTEPLAEQLKSLQVGIIYFGDGSSRLSAEDVSILRAVSDIFRQTGGKVRVIGHSSMGAQAFASSHRDSVNYRMSLKRANVVARELIRQGIPAADVDVIAQGDRAPAYAETSRAGAAYNRRAEIFIDYLERS
ncbi:MAG: hypothetical protein CFH10_00862 [Alphaproteobacteria bacterium MarineAlpha4_Bin2]|nr:MAG: hypothetical protein CFH10_00862 [Alphaproteobacteria bacterium MarineAlpha4_Bin2]